MLQEINTTETLTPELLDLMEHEKVIEQGMATFVEVGMALSAIRDDEKYKHAGYATFEGYCRDRWDLSRSRAYQMIDAAEVSTMVDTPTLAPIANERQARALAPLAKKDPEKAVEVYATAVQRAQDEDRSVTAADITKAVAALDASEDVADGEDPPPITKTDLGGGVSHPARYSNALLPVFAEVLEGFRRVLDPFAGTGKIHALRDLGDFDTVGVEIEPEWADLHEGTIIGNALDLAFTDGEFDAICTSPTYGNRLADHHDASDPERRRSYTHDLGRKLHADNSGAMQWGDEYQEFHEAAWREAVRVLRPGGTFVLNIKDHVRDGVVQGVTIWHVATLVGLGLELTDSRTVATPHLRAGANADLRCPEWVITFRKVRSVS